MIIKTTSKGKCTCTTLPLFSDFPVTLYRGGVAATPTISSLPLSRMQQQLFDVGRRRTSDLLRGSPRSVEPSPNVLQRELSPRRASRERTCLLSRGETRRIGAQVFPTSVSSRCTSGTAGVPPGQRYMRTNIQMNTDIHAQ